MSNGQILLMFRVCFFLICTLSLTACKKNKNQPNETVNTLPGTLSINGDPASAQGAKWTYSETGSIHYQLEGVLYKPAGSGPFPAVLISHGTGGSALSYSSSIAKKIVSWGYVCIAVNYTHASSSVPCGAPGSCIEADGEWGASGNNLLRAMKTREILISMAYVDSTRLAATGHSRGAFVTTYIAGNYPNSFNAFAHTAGGVNTGAEPSAATASRITRPYLIQHGDADNVVPIERDYTLRDLLNARSVTNTMYVYTGYTHAQISNDSMMLVRMKQWFDQYAR